MARNPAAAAPQTILIDAVSLSPCKKTPPSSGSRLDKYSGISFCGVIGYPAKNRQPARTAASAIASFPFINTFSTFSSPSFSRLFIYFDCGIRTHNRAQLATCAFFCVDLLNEPIAFAVCSLTDTNNLLRADCDAVATAFAQFASNNNFRHIGTSLLFSVFSYHGAVM